MLERLAQRSSIWRRCHVECGRRCVKGRSAAARTLLSHPTPTPPHRIWRRCHVECDSMYVEEGTQLQGRYCPTPSHPIPPHPTASEDDAMLSVTARMSRRERSCKDVIVPPHPTPPHLKTMPCWVWQHVCRGGNAAARTLLSHPIPPHPTPPHRIWRRCHVECDSTYVEEGTQLQGRYCPTPPHPTASEDDAMLSVAASVSKERTQLQGRYCPTPPHPTASEDDAMLSVTASVSKEGTQLQGRYCPTPPHPTPPHRIWRRCHVEGGRKCVKGRNAAASTLLSHPTPPHPTASEDDAMLSVTARMLRRERSCTHCIWRRCHVECGTWRRCHAECRSTDLGCKVMRILVSESRGFWLRNHLFLVAEWIVLFWLRHHPFLVAESFFLVAEAPFFGCGSVSDFGCGIVEIWLRKQSDFIHHFRCSNAIEYLIWLELFTIFHPSQKLSNRISSTHPIPFLWLNKTKLLFEPPKQQPKLPILEIVKLTQSSASHVCCSNQVRK